jgi:hypothetical protein
MAEVTPNDVVLMPWKDTQPGFQIVPPGDPRLPAAAQVSGALMAKFPNIRALATVIVRGTPGDDLSLWRFGFIQLSFIHHDWAQYRGQTMADGSVFVARDRPPAMRNNICRDSVAESGLSGALERFPFVGPVIFYDSEMPMTSSLNGRMTGFMPVGTKVPVGGKLLFTVMFGDSPSPRWWGLNRINRTAQKVNDIYSLQYGHAFATMFAMQKGPGKPIDILKSFQWNVRWRAHFQGNTFNVTAAPRSGDLLDMNISHVVRGQPNDHRFQSRIFDITLPNCNNQIREASNKPVIRESARWEDWKVSH